MAEELYRDKKSAYADLVNLLGAEASNRFKPVRPAIQNEGTNMIMGLAIMTAGLAAAPMVFAGDAVGAEEDKITPAKAHGPQHDHRKFGRLAKDALKN